MEGPLAVPLSELQREERVQSRVRLPCEAHHEVNGLSTFVYAQVFLPLTAAGTSKLYRTPTDLFLRVNPSTRARSDELELKLTLWTIHEYAGRFAGARRFWRLVFREWNEGTVQNMLCLPQSGARR